MNLEKARFNMIEQQIRPWQPISQDVRDLLNVVRREDFVPAAFRRLAFSDVEIPLSHGAVMLEPMIEARALDALGADKHEKVLEIGTGSGYMAALLAAHAGRVWSIEIEPELAAQARANLTRGGIVNVTVVDGDGALGWPAEAPYDVIMVSAALPYLPQELLAQLKVGGRLFAIVGREPAMTARLVTRVGEEAFRSEGLFETVTAPMRNVPARPSFVF